MTSVILCGRLEFPRFTTNGMKPNASNTMSANSPYWAIDAANIAKKGAKVNKIPVIIFGIMDFYIKRFLCLSFMAKSEVPERTQAHMFWK